MNREQLLASLQINTEDRGGVYLAGRYIDWSVSDDNSRRFEVGDDNDAVSIELTWPEIERLQRALTLLLLERES